MSIAEAIQRVHTAVAQAAIDAGREPDAVQVLAATKTQPIDRLKEALTAGQTLMAENRAQEVRDKAPLLASHSPPPEWHFIGRLQKNKIKYVVPWASLIHTVDSLALAEAISSRAPGPIGVLIQVNTGGDTAKGGVGEAEALELAKAIARIDKLTVRGGYIDGDTMEGDAAIAALSEMPSKDELRAKVLGLMKMVPGKFLALMQTAPKKGLALLLARQAKLEEEGGE